MELEGTIKAILRRGRTPYAYEVRLDNAGDIYVGSAYTGGYKRILDHVGRWIDQRLDFTLHFCASGEKARAKEAELIDRYQAERVPLLNQRGGNIEKDDLTEQLLEQWSKERWRGEAQDLRVPSLWLYKTDRMSFGYYAWHVRKQMPLRQHIGLWPGVSLAEARAVARELDKEFKKPR